MSREPGVPPVDPLRNRGQFHRALTALLRTKVGRWIAINGSARIDPFLLKVTRGRLCTAVIFPTANLITIGAKSGLRRTATVLYFSDGDDVILVASSFGRDKHPAWYHNLKVHPEATLMSDGRSGRYRAVEVDEDDERERLFALVDRVYGGYADYRERASQIGRRIPIMRLHPIA